ncbi:MAG: DNA-binding transcriptional LysR family regulator [Paracoccaceae bacterium]|jgi:DNA-binding transcriptional LysR family regulator
MPKLESLRTFVTVANAGNIADAALVLNRTASAISMSLKQLEAAIGAPLFETDRKNALTALGRYTLETLEVQIQGYDAAIKAVRAYATNAIGRLSITSVPSVATTLIPDVLSDFLASRPGVEVELSDADSRSTARMIDSGITEIGFAGQPTSAARLTFTPLFSDRFRVVFGNASKLSSIDRPLVWRDLEDQHFIRNEASDAIKLPELRPQYFAAHLIVRNVTSLLAMVRTNMGVTLLPALATRHLPPGVTARDIDFRGSERVVGLITRKGQTLSPVAGAFVDHLNHALPELAVRLGVNTISEPDQ